MQPLYLFKCLSFARLSALCTTMPGIEAAQYILQNCFMQVLVEMQTLYLVKCLSFVRFVVNSVALKHAFKFNTILRL